MIQGIGTCPLSYESSVVMKKMNILPLIFLGFWNVDCHSTRSYFFHSLFTMSSIDYHAFGIYRNRATAHFWAHVIVSNLLWAHTCRHIQLWSIPTLACTGRVTTPYLCSSWHKCAPRYYYLDEAVWMDWVVYKANLFNVIENKHLTGSLIILWV